MATPLDARPPRRRGLLDWKAILGILVGGGLLYYSFRGVNLREVWAAVRQADPWLYLLSAAAATGVFWIRAWRWKSMLVPVAPRTSFHGRFAAVTIGFMANNVLPARMGEFVRAYALSRLEPVPLVASFGSLVLERLFDAMTVLLLLFVAVALPDFPAGRSGGVDYLHAARVLAGVGALAFLFVLLLVLWPRRIVAVTERLTARILPKSMRRLLVDSLEAFLGGISAIRSPRLLVRISFWSLVLWIFNSLGFYIGFRAFHLNLPFTAAIFLQSIIAMAVAAPSLPGFFGIFEGAAKVVLVTWGKDPAQAVAFAAGFHIAGYVPVTILGLYYARRLGITLGEVRRSEEAVESEVEGADGTPPPPGPPAASGR